MQSVCYLTLITSAHPRSLTLFTSLHALASFHSVPQQLFPAIKIIILSHGATKLILKVKFLENTLSVRVVLIGTVILSVRYLDTFVTFVGCFAWYVNSCSFYFLMFC